jgi:RNA recognition motif-containing protein
MNIYVGNLSFRSEESEVQTLFEAYGNVSSVKIIKDNFTGRSKGFGFVTMDDDQEARKAISELSGHNMGGQVLTVNEARPRTNDGDRRSGGNGNYGGGSNYGGGNRGGYGGGKRW